MRQREFLLYIKVVLVVVLVALVSLACAKGSFDFAVGDVDVDVAGQTVNASDVRFNYDRRVK